MNLKILFILCFFIGTASAELTISAPDCVELGESIANTSITVYDNNTPVIGATVMYSLESGTSFGPFYTDANGHPSQGFTPDSLGVLTIVAGANGKVAQTKCSTIVMVVALKPLMQFGIKEVKVATMQAISGAGYDGVPSMAILDNLIPYIDGEEEKMETETLKLLGDFNGSEVINLDAKVSASCHRVNIMDGHTEAIWVKMGDNPSTEEVIDAFLNFNPDLGGLPSEPEKVIVVHDDPFRPQPRLDRDLGNGMSVSVGRIREGIRYIAMGHNTIRGAAGASVLNAELLCKIGKL